MWYRRFSLCDSSCCKVNLFTSMYFILLQSGLFVSTGIFWPVQLISIRRFHLGPRADLFLLRDLSPGFWCLAHIGTRLQVLGWMKTLISSQDLGIRSVLRVSSVYVVLRRCLLSDRAPQAVPRNLKYSDSSDIFFPVLTIQLAQLLIVVITRHTTSLACSQAQPWAS